MNPVGYVIITTGKKTEELGGALGKNSQKVQVLNRRLEITFRERKIWNESFIGRRRSDKFFDFLLFERFKNQVYMLGKGKRTWGKICNQTK